MVSISCYFFKSKSFLLFTVLASISAYVVKGCDLGCSVCSANQATNQSICSVCQTGFQLNTQQNLCVYQGCQSQMYFEQQDNNNQGQCVAICGTQNTPNVSQNTCNPSYQCSNQYVQPSGTNKASSIQSVFVSGTSDEMYLVYSQFINSINQATGSFTKSYTFDISIFSVQQYKSNVFLFGNNKNSIFMWEPRDNILYKLLEISLGTLKVSSQIMEVYNNSTILLVTSINDVTKSLVFSSFNTTTLSNLPPPAFQISLLDGSSVYLFQRLIAQQSVNWQIQIFKVIQNTDLSLSLIRITPAYICSQAQGIVQFVYQNSQSNTILVQFASTAGVYQISADGLTCTQVYLTNNPLKVQEIDYSMNGGTFSLVLVGQSSGSLIGFDFQSQKQVFTYTANSIIDFLGIAQSLNTIQVFILNKLNIIENFSVQISFSSSNNQFHSVIQANPQIQSYIQNPSKLLLANPYTDSSGNLKSLNLIFLVYQNAQFIEIANYSTLGISQDFQDKVYQNESTVNAVSYFSSAQLIVSCGSDGKVIVWNALIMEVPIFFYQTKKTGQKCLDVKFLSTDTIVVQYTNEIDIFNVFNQLDTYSYPIQATLYTQLFVQQNYLFVLNGFSFFIFKQRQQVYQTETITLSNASATIIKFYVGTNLNVIFIDSTNLLTNFQFIDGSPVIFQINSSVTPYQSTYPILTSFFFPQLTASTNDQIFLGDNNKNVIILDVQFNVILIQYLQFGLIQYLNTNDNLNFFLIVKVYDVTASYQYGTVYFDLAQKQQNYIGTLLFALSIPVIYTFVQPDGSNLFEFWMVCPIGYTSYSFRVQYYKSTQLFNYDRFYYTPTQNEVSYYGDQANQVILVGSAVGEVRINHLHQDQAPQTLYYSTNASDNIYFIQQSYKIGLAFIATSYQIKGFSIHTNAITETLSFKTLPSAPASPAILNLVVSNNLYLLISYTAAEFIMKNYQTNQFYSLPISSSSNLQLSTVNGVYIDEVTQSIFIFGSDLVVADVNASKFTKLTSLSSNSQYQACIFTTASAYCSMNGTQLHIFVRAPSFSILVVVLVQSALNGFQFQIDQDNQQILVYKQLISVYSISGVLQQTISSVTTPILWFQIAGQFILAFTSSSGYIFNRGTFVAQTPISPAGGTITGMFYIAYANQIAFYTNQIRYGQILLYNLNNQQSAGSITFTFTQDQIGLVVQTSFDADCVMLNYIDIYGNFQNVIFSTSKTTDNLIMNKDYQNEVVSQPLGYVLDFDQNSVYIYGSNSLYKINYNLLTRPMTTIIKRDQVLQIILNQQINGVSQQVLIFVDYWNNLFTYSDYAVNYSTSFNTEVVEIQTYTQNNHQIVLICFINSILVFKDTFNFALANASLVVSNYTYRRKLLNSSGRYIFNSVLNEIIDYDFLNNNQLAYLQLNIQDFILCQVELGGPTHNFWYLFIGTKFGNIIQYNLNTQVIKQIAPLESSPVLYFVSLSQAQDSLAIVVNSGNIYQVDTATVSLSTSQNIQSNRKKQTIDGGSINTSVNFLYIDISFSRYFINLKHEKNFGVYSLADHSFIQYISFPDDEYKKVVQNSNFLILASAAQINVYNNNLQYINRLRRYNRKDRISDLRIINNNIVIIVFNSRIESIFIDTIQQVVTSVDVVTLTNPRLALLQILSNQQALQIVGISASSIFDKRISLELFSSTGQTNLANPNNICSSSLAFTDLSAISNQYNYLINANTNKMSIILSVLIDNELRSMSFLKSNNANIVIRPMTASNNILYLDTSSFQLLPFNLNLENFSIQLNSTGTFSFHQQSVNITLQDITITNQAIPGSTSFIFQSNQNVILNNIGIQNVNFTQASGSTQRILSSSSTISSSFLEMNNCQTIVISNMNIQNVNFQNPSSSLIQIINSNSVIIQNISITNSLICGNIFTFEQIQNINIQNINISNCYCNTQQSQNTQQTSSETISGSSFIFNFVGILSLSISNYSAQNNNEIQHIYTSRQYQQPQGILTLSTDVLSLSNISISNNKFVTTFNIDYQRTLFYIQSSSVSVTNVNFSQNQGNFIFSTCSTVNILTGSFTQNEGVNGASLSFYDISISVLISDSTFSLNKATSSGGAIMVQDVNQFSIDSKSTVSENKAQIGGGIRIISAQPKTDLEQSQTEVIKCVFKANQGEIYGNSIGRYPAFIQIYNVDLNNKSNLLNEQPIQTFTDAEMVSVKELQSGGLVSLNIVILDSDKSVFQINTELIKNNNYPISIQNELSSYTIEITDLSSVKLVSQTSSSNTQTITISSSSTESVPADIKGEALVTAKQFNSTINSFSFTTLSLSYIPKQVTQSIVIKFSINSSYNSMIIPLSLQFRECIRGEIPISSSSTIVTCQMCPSGSYSLIDPNQDASLMKSIDLQCKKCPDSAKSCESDQIILESGYWRLNVISDTIVACNSFNSFICNEEDLSSRNGCIKGYVGPLCETCDIKGEVWEGNRYTSSFSDFQCNPCSQQSYQIFFIVLSIVAVIFYLIFSIIMFMNSYIYNSTCCYLRLMCILPLSKRAIKDESTFFIKALVNYMQLSAVLFQFQMTFLPQLFAVVPSIAGQPVSKIIVSSSCLYKIQDIENYGEERLRAVVQSTFPFFFLVICFVILQILQKLKLQNVGIYHKYTMVNFLFLFFQPDSISFFTSALSCRQIGDQRYVTINLLVSCEDQSYSRFKYSIIIPNLLFWALFPLVIFYYMMKYHHKKGNMDYCTTKYRYGYFYMEFKKQFCFWEFIRIYYKLAIVIIVTLFDELSLLMYIFCIIVIFTYTFFAQKFEPFESRMLLRLEIWSSFILIINVFLSQVNEQYSSIPLQLGLAFIHYGFIILLILIVIKFKIRSSKGAVGKILHKIALAVLPQRLYKIIFKHKVDSFKTLLLWRKIYKNLLLLREKKANDQIKQIESTQKSRIQNQQQKLIQSKLMYSLELQKRQTIHSVNMHSKRDDSTLNEIKTNFNKFQGQDSVKEQSFSKSQYYNQDNASPLESSNKIIGDAQFKSTLRTQKVTTENDILTTDRQRFFITTRQEATFTNVPNFPDEQSEESRNINDIEFEEENNQQSIYGTKPIQQFRLTPLLKSNQKQLQKEEIMTDSIINIK